MARDDTAGARRRRALEEPLDVRPDDAAFVVSAEVRNPRHRTRYRVYFPAFPRREAALCTCPDFDRRGLGTCKHIEAAALALVDSGEQPPVAVPSPQRVRATWAEVDRRLEAPPVATAPTIAVRWPGRALIDPGVR